MSDEVEKQLKEIGELPVSIEGYEAAEWILMDYGDFIVHIFSASARSYYDLERLWRHGKSLEPNFSTEPRVQAAIHSSAEPRA